MALNYPVKQVPAGGVDGQMYKRLGLNQSVLANIKDGVTGGVLTFIAALAGNININLPTASGTLFTNPLTALGDTMYGGASGVVTRLAGNITATKQFLTQTGTGTVSAAPAWAAIAASDLPTFGAAAAGIVPASGGGTTNFLRADGTWAAAGGGGGLLNISSTVASDGIILTGSPSAPKTWTFPDNDDTFAGLYASQNFFGNNTFSGDNNFEHFTTFSYAPGSGIMGVNVQGGDPYGIGISFFNQNYDGSGGNKTWRVLCSGTSGLTAQPSFVITDDTGTGGALYIHPGEDGGAVEIPGALNVGFDISNNTEVRCRNLYVGQGASGPSVGYVGWDPLAGAGISFENAGTDPWLGGAMFSVIGYAPVGYYTNNGNWYFKDLAGTNTVEINTSGPFINALTSSVFAIRMNNNVVQSFDPSSGVITMPLATADSYLQVGGSLSRNILYDTGIINSTSTLLSANGSFTHIWSTMDIEDPNPSTGSNFIDVLSYITLDNTSSGAQSFDKIINLKIDGSYQSGGGNTVNISNSYQIDIAGISFPNHYAVGDHAGIIIEAPHFNTGTTCDNDFGIRIGGPVVNGAITTQYGLYIGAPSVGSGTITNRYGIYQLDTAAKNIFSGQVVVNTAGKGISIKEGSNAKLGTSVLVGGTVVVANTSVTANSRIFLCCLTPGGTPGFLRVSAQTNGASFTILSSSVLDTSTVSWMIVEAA